MKVYVDGASRGNPGRAGIGVVLCNERDEPVKEVSEAIGETTNNVAEYRALIRGLEEARALGADAVEVFTDSELLARQMNGLYGVHAPHLLPLYRRAKTLLRLFRSADVRHIPRSLNRRADTLAKAAAGEEGAAGHESFPSAPSR
ncbi:MAG: ribonuclease HI family protein [bacterium]|nr:ribonuclease HI family protein [bacterium]